MLEGGPTLRSIGLHGVKVVVRVGVALELRLVSIYLHLEVDVLRELVTIHVVECQEGPRLPLRVVSDVVVGGTLPRVDWVGLVLMFIDGPQRLLLLHLHPLVHGVDYLLIHKAIELFILTAGHSVVERCHAHV